MMWFWLYVSCAVITFFCYMFWDAYDNARLEALGVDHFEIGESIAASVFYGAAWPVFWLAILIRAPYKKFQSLGTKAGQQEGQIPS